MDIQITLRRVLLATLCALVPTVYAHDTWDDVRYHGVVEQGLDNSCGFASLLTITRSHYGDERYDERELLRLYMKDASEEVLSEAMSKGLSLRELETVAQTIGYKTAKKIVSYGNLIRATRIAPTLVYLEIGAYRHFAVVRSASSTHVSLADPSRGNVYYSKAEFLAEWRHFTQGTEQGGIALLILGTPRADGGLQKIF